MPMRTFLGVDLGTSGLKLTLLDEVGVVRAESEASYELSSARPGWAETDPPVWSAALTDALGHLGSAQRGVELAGVSFAGQMHGVVLADPHGAPVRPAALWPDTRADEVLSAWHDLPSDVRARLGPIATGMAGPLLTWLARHEPATLARTATVLAPKDWLRSQLTGDRVTERSDASASLLWDVVADEWSAPAVRLAGVRSEQLPQVRGSAETVGSWDGAPVAAGGADVACALTAVAAAVPSVWPRCRVVNAGSGVQVVRPGAAARPREAPVTHLFADAEGGWYEMVGVRNGGLTLRWVQESLRLSWNELLGAAAAAEPGSGGVVLVPFLTGERGGVAPLRPRAGWTGLGPTTGVAELARSALEALGFTIRRSLELLSDADGPVILCGGGARDPSVRRLLADCLGEPLTYVPLRSASAVGAALLAARAVGHAVEPAVESVTIDPSPDTRIDEAYSRWLAAVDANRPRLP